MMPAIVLPIKEQFVQKILSGEKRYEYRKKLCKREIGKIYLYATAPVCRVLGEVEVTGKLTLPKDKLWSDTESCSGVDKKEFERYFEGKELACAYALGKVKRYARTKRLEEFGINYILQSFAYLPD